MARVLIHSKHFLPSSFILRKNLVALLPISSKSYCSKDDKSLPEGTVSQKSEVKDAKSGHKDAPKLNLAKPVKRTSKKERLEKMKSEMSTPEKEMDLAVKNVASSFKDPKKIESDLSEKLSSLKLSKQAHNETDESKFDNAVNEKLMSSVEDVAETITEKPIPPRKQLAEKLIQTSKERQSVAPNRQRSMYYNDGPQYRLRRGGQMSVMAQLRMEAELDAAKKAARADSKRSIQRHEKEESFRLHRGGEKSVIEQMRLEARLKASGKEDARTEQKSSYDRPPREQREMSPRDQQEDMSVIGQMRKEARLQAASRKESKPGPKRPAIRKVDLFGSAPLNIFSLETETKAESRNLFWNQLQEKELRLLTQFAPLNGFEEMIQWTEQGKHWKFPIDNQAEMKDEENVGFHEHVFLERHLDGFPKKGPIRHFMELVVVGLSKNPYISVQRKVDNIDWFRNYFKEKESILKETGALD